MSKHVSINTSSASVYSGLTSIDGATGDMAFKKRLAAIIPNLRAFARGLCGSRVLADYIAQDAVALGWTERASFEPGTSFEIWMFGILRNHFYSVTPPDRTMLSWDVALFDRGPAKGQQSCSATQSARTASTLQHLPAEQREVLTLVEGHGLSYAEVAEVIGASTGSVKLLLTQGREALGMLLDRSEPEVQAANWGHRQRKAQ